MTTASSQAKQGNPTAIAALINRSLHGKNVTAKVSSNNGCLVIVLESPENVKQEALAPFIKNGIIKLHPDHISSVVIRGRVTGSSSDAWKESFSLESAKNQEISDRPRSSNTVSPTKSLSYGKSTVLVSPSKGEGGFLAPLQSFIKTRNGERTAIVLATFLLTTGLWLSVESLVRHKNTVTVGESSPETITSDQEKNLPASYSIMGTLTLIDSDIARSGSTCYGTGGYEDIQSNMAVTIRDGNGNIIASGRTGSGSTPASSDPDYSSVVCAFEFKVDNVPKSAFYSIEVGHRGELNYSFEEMQQQNWQVSFSLS